MDDQMMRDSSSERGWLGGYQGEPNGRANIAESERLPSLVIGGCLLAYGLVRRSLGGVLLGAVGAELLYRGVTSYCPVNSVLGVNRAPGDHNPNATILHGAGIKIDKSVTINKPVDEIYAFWRGLERLPQFMRHLVAVTPIDDNRSHWVAKAPAGRTVEWDAEIINEIPNELIAWRSVGDTDIPNAGSVRFRPAVGGRGTVVRVEMAYDPPTGIAGAMAAKLWGEEPATQVDDDLRHLKQIMEAGEVATARSA